MGIEVSSGISITGVKPGLSLAPGRRYSGESQRHGWTMNCFEDSTPTSTLNHQFPCKETDYNREQKSRSYPIFRHGARKLLLQDRFLPERVAQDWNFLLNKDGGPNHVGNVCSAPLLADLEKEPGLPEKIGSGEAHGGNRYVAHEDSLLGNISQL